MPRAAQRGKGGGGGSGRRPQGQGPSPTSGLHGQTPQTGGNIVCMLSGQRTPIVVTLPHHSGSPRVLHVSRGRAAALHVVWPRVANKTGGGGGLVSLAPPPSCPAHGRPAPSRSVRSIHVHTVTANPPPQPQTAQSLLTSRVWTGGSVHAAVRRVHIGRHATPPPPPVPLHGTPRTPLAGLCARTQP